MRLSLYPDVQLALNKVAPYYYYSGFWEGGPTLSFRINLKNAAMANVDMLAKYDAKNLAALRGLVAGGAQLRPYPKDVMKAAFAAANKLYAEIAATNPDFATIRAHTKAFRNEANLWNQVAEYTFDTCQISNRRKG